MAHIVLIRNFTTILVFILTALEIIQGGIQRKPPVTPRDLDCYKDSVAYVKDIPHPTNCKSFLSCQYMGTHDGVYALLRDCAASTEFSMKTCQCEYPYSDDADCFNMSNPVHVQNRMKCAEVAQLGLGGPSDSSEEDFHPND